MRKVVITGLGTVLPGTGSTDDLWADALAGRSAVGVVGSPLDSKTPIRAGLVNDAELQNLQPRLRKRMDRFCHLAMVAAHNAFVDADSLQSVSPERIGVYIGNMYGGWSITDPSLRRLCEVGYTGVSPYIASAWFPTAAQGQISIHLQTKGFSKTIAADSASGAVAVGFGARAIADGRADVVLAGAAEAPVTPYSYTFCITSGRLAGAGGYRPFSSGADGFDVGEGAVVLTLEAEETALRRGVTILAEVAGFATSHASSARVFERDGSALLAATIRSALVEAKVGSAELDYVALDAQGAAAADESEAEALHLALGKAARRPVCSSFKPFTGHLLGAAPMVDVVGAIMAMRYGSVPPLRVADKDVGRLGLDLPRDGPRSVKVRTVLVNSRGADGTIAALLLRAV
jgi:3-oxoacyl-[acyl-carrier-protein] synthase II